MAAFTPFAHSSFLGYDRILDEVERFLSNDVKPVSNFPPTNIIKLDDSRYLVEMAVAGFSKDEIEITTKDGSLTIAGKKAENNQYQNYLQRGIGARSFTKSISIADTVEVKGADLKDGILRIGLENIIPESKKARKIEIGSDLTEFQPQLLQEKKVA